MTKIEQLEKDRAEIKALMVDEESKNDLKEALADIEKQLAEAKSQKPTAKKTLVKKTTADGKKKIVTKAKNDADKADAKEKVEDARILKEAKQKAEAKAKAEKETKKTSKKSALHEAAKKVTVRMGKNKYRLVKIGKNATKRQVANAESKAAKNRRIVKTKVEQMINASTHDISTSKADKIKNKEVLALSEQLKKINALVFLEQDEVIKSEDPQVLKDWIGFFKELLQEGLKDKDTNKFAHIDFAPQYLKDLGIVKSIEEAKKLKDGGQINNSMEILDDNLTDLEKENIEADFYNSEIIEVKTKEEGNGIIKEHFKTLKCKFDEYMTNKGRLWIVYPPQGLYAEALYILIK
ncbi:MAG: hypothetical protein ACTSXL_06000 [Alphaproteobacteria bacterium]